MPSEHPGRRSGSADLPTPPTPQGRYRPAVATEQLAMTAGMTPRVEGRIQYPGRVGAEVSVDDARAAAAIAVANAVSALAELLGSTDRIAQVLRMTVYVNAGPGFVDHSLVADGASERLVELLADRGAAVRSAVGVASLPGDACVEVELTCARG